MDAKSYDDSSLANDANWEKVPSSQFSDDSENYLYAVYTRKASKTNTPLQQLSWRPSLPCAFTDQANDSGNSKSTIIFHIAEHGYYLEPCKKAD